MSSDGSRSGSASSRLSPMAIATTLTAIGSPAPTCLTAHAPNQALTPRTHAHPW